MRYPYPKLSVIGIFALAATLLVFISPSCKKTDFGQSDPAKEEAFFRTSSKDPNVLRLIASLKAQNERTHFVSKLPKNAGAPIWDKYVMRSKKIDKSIFWRGGEPDSVAVIPFTSNNENLSAIIVYDSSTVSPALDCYTTNGNLYAVCHNATVDIDKAEQMLAMFLQMENRVFSTTVFYHIPAKIFKNPALPDTATVEKMLVIDTVTVQGFAADDCFVIKYCNPGGVCTPPTYCDNCSVCPWVYYCDSPPPGDPGGGGGDPTPPPTNPPPTGGGGGGNCTNCPPPPPEPCPFGGAWYNFVPTYEPCGPTSPIPTEEPPSGSPNFIIIDSSFRAAYPCQTNLLLQMESLCGLSEDILRNIFGVTDDIELKLLTVNDPDTAITAFFCCFNYTPLTFKGQIKFNTNTLNKATNEFLVVTYIHEAVHAFIDYQRIRLRNGQIDSTTFKTMFPIYWNTIGTDTAQHLTMTQNYINKFKTVLANYNPNLPDSILTALAWHGLGETTTWKLQPDTARMLRIQRDALNTGTGKYLTYGPNIFRKCP